MVRVTITRPNRLADAREARGMTQQKLADLAGITRPEIGLYEIGHREPRVGAAVRIAQALHTPVERIWPTNEDEPKAATEGSSTTTTSEAPDAEAAQAA
jgi:putative transcriptional regulator